MEIHRIVCGNVNCYIVAENGNAILIDTGRKKYRENLSAPIAMHEKDRNLIPDNRTQLLSAKTFLGKIVLSVSLQSFEKDVLDVFEPTVYLKDGDNLSAYGVDARVVEMPGHTNGSIGLKIGDGLFVGDALMNMFFPTVAMLYTDEKMMKQSARQISGIGKLKIYFGHGKPVNNRNWI